MLPQNEKSYSLDDLTFFFRLLKLKLFFTEKRLRKSFLSKFFFSLGRLDFFFDLTWAALFFLLDLVDLKKIEYKNEKKIII